MTSTAPGNSEFELSLFGRGVGECIVAHLGAGQWLVVDSFLDRESRLPIAIRYLNSLGVDVANAIRVFVVTHWHDDHIGGASALLEASPNARFCCSLALQVDQFYELVGCHTQLPFVSLSSGISEFSGILDILKQRSGAKGIGSPIWANVGKVLYRIEGDCPITVTAVSPSDYTCTCASLRFGQLLPQVGELRRRLPSLRPNDQSVALLLETPQFSYLLGADLENGSDANGGWAAVVASETISKRFNNVFKIPHHGSKNAHSDGVWNSLAGDETIAILTTYLSGVKPLPTPSDIRRLRQLAAEAYCTTPIKGRRPPKRRGADKILNKVARSRMAVSRKAGHIRIRAPFCGGGKMVVDCFDGAGRLRG